MEDTKQRLWEQDLDDR